MKTKEQIREQSVQKKERLRIRREKKKQHQEAKKLRKRIRTERRRLKRVLKAVPRKTLAEWSKSVRSCDRCAVCGTGIRKKTDSNGQQLKSKKGKLLFTKLDAHHLLPKERYQEYRCVRINGICLCPTHHKYGKYSAHRNPIWFALWLQINRPHQYQWCLDHMGKEVTIV